ncbi:hypothetical protein CF392_07605 [Tamilnaduibacter salinus]|uniref:Sulfotransferase domain-containing protein n=1 Tax=Tamilnaduibacter salinus TaxID=1484056 RepID=A0A2A2I3V9_9GAMM|nr:sulfotransferase [Tamilnaduibacter salinus]PAV26088.1 hypothetical protein CF392_07605 [Tamilnaduibacter salinus]
MRDKRVDFFFVGPGKTASTWIYKVLKEHPQFSLPSGKDIYFFDQFFERGENWYHDQFTGCDFDKLVGEFSHDYLISSTALGRIREYNPDARIIVCLRNPYDRLQSGIRFLQRNGYGYAPVERLVQRHPELIEGGLYAKNLARLYAFFPKERVLLLFFEELKFQPSAFIQRLYDFFCVEWHSPDVLQQKVNVASQPRSRVLALTVKKAALVARNMGLGRLVGRIKMSRVVAKILYRRAESEFSLTDEDKLFLSQWFDHDIRQLEKMLKADLSHWKVRKCP